MPTTRRKTNNPARKRNGRLAIDLALQGGGSHGAFTWGVLDRLLQEEDIDIQGISGTSAGAMNGAVLLSGHARGGREGARKALEAFWRDISLRGSIYAPFKPSSLPGLAEHWNLDGSFWYRWFELATHLFSPYELNPLNLNPLRDVLAQHANEKDFRRCQEIKLYVTATSVRTGQQRVFSRDDLTLDAMLASACLPFFFQAVEIEGEPYWDGGYMGNPAMHPLIYNTPTSDIVLVRVNPLYRPDTPRRAMEIVNRINEITFNAPLIAEMRAIYFVTRLIRENRLDKSRYKLLKLHMIDADHELDQLNGSSKFNTDWAFFRHLHGVGIDAAQRWLAQHKRYIGVRSTLDIGATFLARPGEVPGGSNESAPRAARNGKRKRAQPGIR